MSQSTNGLEPFLQCLVPPILRDELKPESPDRIRARALMLMLMASTLMIFMGALTFLVQHLFFKPHLLSNHLVSVLLILLFGIQTVHFWRRGNLWLAGTLFLTTYFLLSVGMVLASGGIESPLKSVLITYPIAAYLIGGRPEGFQATLGTFLFILGLAILKSIEFNLPNLSVGGNSQLIFLISWLCSLVIISFCIAVYENELQNQIDGRSAPLRRKENGMTPFSKKFDRLMHNLVPEPLRDRSRIKTKNGMRAIIVAMMLVTACATSLLSAIILISIHLIFYPDQLKYDWVIAAITLCFALQTGVFYHFKNILLSSYLLAYFYFLIVLVLVIFTGGYDAPNMILLLLSPVVFFMLLGIMDGIQNAIFVGIAGIAFTFLKQIEIPFINVFHDVNQTMVFAISWSIVVLATAVCMLAYDEVL